MSSTGTRDSNEALLYDDGKNISNDYVPLNHCSTWTPWYRRPLPWILTTAFLFVTNSMLLVYSATAWHYCKPSQFGSFEAGFTTDLEPAKVAIEGRRINFSGELKFHENKTMYRDYEGEPVYVGPPSAEIDANWDTLLEGSGLDLAGAEADSVKDWTFEEAQGGLWRTGNGLDVFHQLHCLNFVRKSLDLDYYKQDDPSRLFLLHRDHCLDYVRQALMCSADATPVRLEWRKESQYLIPKFDRPHTCRNFELLHEWSKGRDLQHHMADNREAIRKVIDEGLL